MKFRSGDEECALLVLIAIAESIDKRTRSFRRTGGSVAFFFRKLSRLEGSVLIWSSVH